MGLGYDNRGAYMNNGNHSGLVLTRLREILGKTQSEVADEVSSSQTLVSRHEREGGIGKTWIARYADYYAVSTDVIIGLAPIPQGYSKEYRERVRAGLPLNLPRNAEAYIPGPVVLLPVYSEVSAGAPCMADERPIDHRAVDASRVQHDLDNFYLLRVKGESMILDGIMPGGLVLVHKQETIDDNQIAVVSVKSDGVTIKRVRHIGNDNILLVPRNTAMREELLPVEDVLICGRVVQTITDFD